MPPEFFADLFFDGVGQDGVSRIAGVNSVVGEDALYSVLVQSAREMRAQDFRGAFTHQFTTLGAGGRLCRLRRRRSATANFQELESHRCRRGE